VIARRVGVENGEPAQSGDGRNSTGDDTQTFIPRVCRIMLWYLGTVKSRAGSCPGPHGQLHPQHKALQKQRYAPSETGATAHRRDAPSRQNSSLSPTLTRALGHINHIRHLHGNAATPGPSTPQKPLKHAQQHTPGRGLCNSGI